jgi:hypothetical protein
VRKTLYLGVTLALAAAGTVTAAIGGYSIVAVGAGVGVAWIVQAGSFWLLAGGLERGEPVTRVWVAGITARFGAGIVVWLLAALAGAPTRDLMVAYGLTLVLFLLLEAGWLAFATTDRTIRRT